LRPSKSQRKLSAQATYRAERLLRIASTTASFDPEVDRKIGYVLLEVHNLWASYWRQVYFSAVLLEARNRNDNRIFGRRLLSERQAVVEAVRHVDARRAQRLARAARITHRDEPNWFDQSQCERIFRGLGFADQTDWIRLLAFDGQFASNAPTIRNFYAHKSRDTHDKLSTTRRNLGLSPDIRPVDIVLSIDPSSGQRIVVRWLTNMIVALSAHG
jgi:hypothetical protein